MCVRAVQLYSMVLSRLRSLAAGGAFDGDERLADFLLRHADRKQEVLVVDFENNIDFILAVFLVIYGSIALNIVNNLLRYINALQ